MYKLIFAYLIVGFIVNLKCLDRPDGFSWKNVLNPFKSGWEESHSDTFIKSAFYTTPFWPVFLLLHLTSAPKEKPVNEAENNSEGESKPPSS